VTDSVTGPVGWLFETCVLSLSLLFPLLLVFCRLHLFLSIVLGHAVVKCSMPQLFVIIGGLALARSLYFNEIQMGSSPPLVTIKKTYKSRLTTLKLSFYYASIELSLCYLGDELFQLFIM
jgi:hypothetical protein